MHYAEFFSFDTKGNLVHDPATDIHAVKILDGRQSLTKRYNICMSHAKRYRHDAFIFLEGRSTLTGKPIQDSPRFHAVWNFNRVRRAETAGRVIYHRDVALIAPPAEVPLEKQKREVINRVCHDCGAATSQYRCNSCWSKIRAEHDMDCAAADA